MGDTRCGLAGRYRPPCGDAPNRAIHIDRSRATVPPRQHLAERAEHRRAQRAGGAPLIHTRPLVGTGFAREVLVQHRGDGWDRGVGCVAHALETGPPPISFTRGRGRPTATVIAAPTAPGTGRATP